MSRRPQFANPFYFILVVMGVAFVVTACAYAVMATHGSAAAAEGTVEQPRHGLLVWLDQYGLTALIVELVLLAIATFAAMLTDDYWDRRAAARTPSSSEDSEPSLGRREDGA